MIGQHEINSLNKFKPFEQLMLLASRSNVGDDEKEYMIELANNPAMDWAAFLGTSFLNRVNGVVYKNIKEIDAINHYVKYFLKIAFIEQCERTRIHQQEIKIIADAFENNSIRYSFMKGAVLNTIFYEPGLRISNDTDIMVDINDLDKAGEILKELGYIQGSEKNGVICPASKKEIMFARLNTYEIVPFIKAIGDRHLSFHEVDINFRLSNEDSTKSAREMLADTVVLHNGQFNIRTLSLENFLMFLCIHHYREATMIFKIVRGEDLSLYKFMDIHVLLTAKKQKIDWDKLYDIVVLFDKIRDVYYTLYYTEIFFPLSVPPDIMEKFKPEDERFINQYKGRDNTNQVYNWKMDLISRAFSNDRRLEAMKNIHEENERYKEIIKQLER